MVGLMSSKVVMQTSVDAYNDECNLHDVQIYSTFGFDEENISLLKDTENVKEVFASKTVDVYSRINGKETGAARIEESDRTIGVPRLVSGRMPKKENEIVLYFPTLGENVYKIGDTVELYLEDSDLSETLSCLTYKIVGFVESPCYSGNILGPGNLDNQELELICYIPSTNFLTDYYTCVYLTFDGAIDLLSYSDEYMALIDEDIVAIEELAETQQCSRKDKLVAEAMEKIEDGKQQLAEEKEKYQKELDEAKAKLDDAKKTIDSYQKQIDDNKKLLADSQKELEENEALLNSKKQELADAIALVESQDSEGRDFDTIYSELETAYNIYHEVKDSKKSVAAWAASMSSEDRNILQQVLGSLGYSVVNAYDSILRLINGAAGVEVEETYEQLSQIKEGQQTIEENEKLLEDAKAQLADGQKQIEEAEEALAEPKRQYQEGLEEYEEGVLEFNEKIADAEAEIKDSELKLSELEEAQWIVLDRDSNYSNYMFRGSEEQMGKIGTSLPLLFFLVAALVCTTTMTRLIDEQRGQIGILRALGYSNGQIRRKYIFYAFLASICGAIPGVFVGMAIFPPVIYNTWRLLYTLPDIIIVFKPEIIAICVLSFTLLMCIVSGLVARRSIKETPAGLMRPKAPKSIRPVFLEKISFIWNKLSFTGKITARNLIRYKSRFFMTVLGVAGCTGLLVLGWGIKDSIEDIVTIQFEDIFKYEYSVNVEEDANIEEFEDILLDLDGSQYVAAYTQYSTKYYGEKDDQTMNAMVLDLDDAQNLFNLRSNDRTTPISLTNEGVIISEKFADLNNLKVGDTITVESESGRRGEVYITGICEMYFQHYMFITEDYYKEVFKQEAEPNIVALVSSSKESPAEYVKEVDGYISTTNFDSMISMFETMIQALDFIILVVLIAAGSLAFVVLINLTQVNISERIREIATLKVLGFRPGEVNSYLFKEIFILSLIGGLLGLPLGVVFHHFIMNIITFDVVKFGMVVKPISYVYAFGVTIVFTLIVMLLTKKSLRDVKMVESLKSVE